MDKTIITRLDGIKKGILLFTVSLMMLLSSCSEEVITVDLKKAAPKIVIEGIITDQDVPCTVTISTTDDFFKPSIFPPVTGALVIVSDDKGNVETLDEIGQGIYRTMSIKGVEGTIYSLKVMVDDQEYTASSTMHIATPIDSLTFEFEENDIDEEEEGYHVHCHFIDHEGIEEFYRLKIYQNGELLPSYFLYYDKYSDGNTIDYKMWEVFDPGDTVRIDLIAIDKAVFDYYMTLVEVIVDDEGGPGVFGPIPDNPISNISNGALGYFGAFAVRSKTVVIQEDLTDR